MTRTIEIVKKEPAYEGFFSVDLYTLKPADTGPTYTREVFNRGNSSCGLIYDPALDKVLLVEELRMGNVVAGLPADQCYSLGPIAGMIDGWEAPEMAFRREAMEEAGIDLRNQVTLGPKKTFPSPGASSEIIFHYIVLADLSTVKDGATFGREDENESTTVRVLDRAEADDMIGRGIGNGLAVTLMLWLETLILSRQI